MKEKFRIKSKVEFDDILSTGSKIKNSYFLLCFKPKKMQNSRFGIAVGKKIGNAVVRNKYKRLIREIIRKNLNNYSKDDDYIIILRKSCDTISFREMEIKLSELILR